MAEKVNYQGIRKQLRPKSRKKLQGVMKAAIKKAKKSGKSVAIEMRGVKK